MTIQTPNATGFNITDFQGAVRPRRNITRLDLFNDIRDQIFRDYPHSRDGAVVAFDLQPNQL
jgi:hypothetical protein